MNNEFNKHKKSDAIKWVVVFIAILALAGGMIAALVPLYSQTNNTTDVDIEHANNSVVLTEQSTNNVKLLTSSIDVEDFDSYAVAASAEAGYVLSATVLPESATNKDLAISCDWANPSSSWASGKDVNDYLTVTKTDTNVWTLSVLNAFGEQIKITVKANNYVEGDTSEENLLLTASCLVDYVKRVDYVSLNVADSSGYISFGESETISYTVHYTDGTLQGQFTGGIVSLTLKTDLYNACCNALTSGNWAKSQTIVSFANLSSTASQTISVGECTRFISATGNPGTGASQWQAAFLNYITNDHTYHATLSMSWSYAYNGTVYGDSSGSATLNVKFDSSSLVVAVASVAMDETNLVV